MSNPNNIKSDYSDYGDESAFYGEYYDFNPEDRKSKEDHKEISGIDLGNIQTIKHTDSLEQLNNFENQIADFYAGLNESEKGARADGLNAIREAIEKRRDELSANTNESDRTDFEKSLDVDNQVEEKNESLKARVRRVEGGFSNNVRRHNAVRVPVKVKEKSVEDVTSETEQDESSQDDKKWDSRLTEEQIDDMREKGIYEPSGPEYEQALAEFGIDGVVNEKAIKTEDGNEQIWDSRLTEEQIDDMREKGIYEPSGPEYEQALAEFGIDSSVNEKAIDTKKDSMAEKNDESRKKELVSKFAGILNGYVRRGDEEPVRNDSKQDNNPDSHVQEDGEGDVRNNDRQDNTEKNEDNERTGEFQRIPNSFFADWKSKIDSIDDVKTLQELLKQIHDAFDILDHQRKEKNEGFDYSQDYLKLNAMISQKVGQILRKNPQNENRPDDTGGNIDRSNMNDDKADANDVNGGENKPNDNLEDKEKKSSEDDEKVFADKFGGRRGIIDSFRGGITQHMQRIIAFNRENPSLGLLNVANEAMSRVNEEYDMLIVQYVKVRNSIESMRGLVDDETINSFEEKMDEGIRDKLESYRIEYTKKMGGIMKKIEEMDNDTGNDKEGATAEDIDDIIEVINDADINDGDEKKKGNNEDDVKGSGVDGIVDVINGFNYGKKTGGISNGRRVVIEEVPLDEDDEIDNDAGGDIVEIINGIDDEVGPKETDNKIKDEKNAENNDASLGEKDRRSDGDVLNSIKAMMNKGVSLKDVAREIDIENISFDKMKELIVRANGFSRKKDALEGAIAVLEERYMGDKNANKKRAGFIRRLFRRWNN